MRLAAELPVVLIDVGVGVPVVQCLIHGLANHLIQDLPPSVSILVD